MRILIVTSQLPANGQALTLAPLARQIESLRRAGAEVNVLEVRGTRRLKYVQVLPTLWQMAAQADLIHAHYAFCGWIARSCLGKPVVCSFMGNDLLGTPDGRGHLRPASRLTIRTSRLLARAVDGVIVKSQEMAAVVAPVPAHVIPNGVDMRAFAPMGRARARAELGWRHEWRYILFPGNPASKRKGFDLAQRAINAAQARSGQRLELVALWGIAPQHVPRTMNACDAMLMTSWLEGSPNVVKEALACNLPVVSVPVGDVADLLRGLEGYAVCRRDPIAIGQALVHILARARRADGRSALQRRRLDLDSVALRIIDLYEQILAQGRPAARPGPAAKI